MVYDLPYFRHSEYFLKNLVGNWEFSPIYIYESPEYVTVLSGADSNLNGDSVDRALVNPNGTAKGQGDGVNPVYSSNLAASCPAGSTTVNGVATCDASLIGYTLSSVHPNAQYVTAAKGVLPTAARNTLPGNPINNLDLTATKKLNITERLHLEFSLYAFNLLNHAQYVPGFSDVINTSATNTLPTSYQTAGASNFNKPGLVFGSNARTVQLSGKIVF
jgi:hypothetical protein